MKNNFGIVLAFLLWVVMAMPGVIQATQATEPKVDPPRTGVNGVGEAAMRLLPRPEKTRKPKISDVVLLDVTVMTDGKITDPIVVKGPGMGVNEKALEQVRTWKLKPARGPDDKPVKCRVRIEVTFHSDSPS
ncbi:MAG TPA: TonB family protein [Verrucomicrobiae bacterium]|nr:TonB family protein [Verrucomicrobiae bacterium]